MPSLRAILTVFLLAACAATAVRANADSRPERVIAYVDADIPRVALAIGKLETALARTGAAARHRIVVRHVTVDLWKPDAVKAALVEVARLRPAVIIATNSQNAAIARSVTRDIPIIFGSHQDPIRMGLAESLARPGGNLTGFTYFVPIDQKRLELLRQVAPHARRLGILIDRWWVDESGGRDILLEAKKKHAFEPELFLAETIEDLRNALSTPKARQMDAWYVPYTALPFEYPADLLSAFEALHKPVVFPATLFVERGGLLSYQPTLTLDESSLIWATMVGLILDGVPPAEIPIERPKAFELAINVATARRLGIDIPAPLLKRAERVIFGDSKQTALAQ
jgi:putative ABC transport system substrate-binding protein